MKEPENMLPKLLFTTLNDPNDVRIWSGLVFNIARVLERQGFDVEFMGNILRDQRMLLKAVERGRSILTGRAVVPVDRRTSTAQRIAIQIENRLMRSDASIVFAPSSIPLALVDTDRPKVFYTDATFAGIIHQYPELADYPAEFLKEGHELERASLRNCDLAMYSSEWAARSAVEDYQADPSKIIVIPFGSNLGSETDAVQVTKAISDRSSEECHLLFVGVHWQRKGGDVVLETLEQLRKMGMEVHLHIIGCVPPHDQLPDHVHVEPFLDKRRSADRQKLIELILKSHFLILPTRADCTPIVVNECNSLGVPCLTSDVGGLPEMIKNGVNGHLFEVDVRGSDYAEVIAKYMGDRAAYEQLANNA
ncbi:MAG: glycosyltransferase family 4 protein, partial [Bacteroidota bacterium]|nr:glycosyltransferase family 4 protein [Bacteroidota bacterium]